MIIIAEAVLGRVETENYEKFEKNGFNRSEKADRENYFRDTEDGKPNFAKYLRDTFKWGRKTAKSCSWNNNRLPDPQNSCDGKGLDENGERRDGLRQVFVDNIFKDQDYPCSLTTAISGAHTLGSTKKENSGFEGFWTDIDRAHIFNNDYYHALISLGWVVDPYSPRDKR
jgi:hypothetical protein